VITLGVLVACASAAARSGGDRAPFGTVKPKAICAPEDGSSGNPVVSCMAVGLALNEGSLLRIDGSGMSRERGDRPAQVSDAEAALADSEVGDSGVVKTGKDKGGKGKGGGSASTSAVVPLTPARLHAAYSLPTTTVGSSGQTIAIVDAFDNPWAKSDLDFYSQFYGIPLLPDCSATVTTSCFEKVNQAGTADYWPAYDVGWAQEIALDLQAAHATCQDCKLLLVEANSNSLSDITASVAMAVAKGATVVSNSYGVREKALTAADFNAFSPVYAQSGVAVVASSGDTGYGAAFPADVSTVVAATGTTLSINTSTGAWVSEKAWKSTGSGCSKLASAPAWQVVASGWSKTKCGSMRGTGDVAAPGDPASGLYVRFNGAWYVIGGTSLSAPVIAGIYGLAANTQAVTDPSSVPYANPTSFHDIVKGKNGSCSTTMCKTATGYDGPSGLGSPIGLGGF
jgi:subtilase family serine protease